PPSADDASPTRAPCGTSFVIHVVPEFVEIKVPLPCAPPNTSRRPSAEDAAEAQNPVSAPGVHVRPPLVEVKIGPGLLPPVYAAAASSFVPSADEPTERQNWFVVVRFGVQVAPEFVEVDRKSVV